MGKCKGCGANVLWIRTTSGRMMPCNPVPVPYYSEEAGDPNATLVTFDGLVVKCYVGDVIDYAPSGIGYVPHWATCPAAGQFRRKK